MEKSIISELAKVILVNPTIHDQVFRTLLSHKEDGFENDQGSVAGCIEDICVEYLNKTFMYLVDPRDREVLYPKYKKRLPSISRMEIRAGKTNRPQPEDIDLEV